MTIEISKKVVINGINITVSTTVSYDENNFKIAEIMETANNCIKEGVEEYEYLFNDINLK